MGSYLWKHSLGGGGMAHLSLCEALMSALFQPADSTTPLLVSSLPSVSHLLSKQAGSP